MKLNHLVESQQFTSEILADLFDTADEMRANPKNFNIALQDKTMASLFYEPSTRTRTSFESAMFKLGGRVTGTENAREFSSAVKGESLQDSIRVIAAYCDAIVLRHHETGAASFAASVSPVPIINAGDGSGQHPTQALLDVYTIKRECGRMENLKVAMVGDLANGRTARSLSYLLSKFPDIQLYFVSPPNLKMGNDIKGHLTEHNVPFVELDDLNLVLPESDVIYMTRVQKERMNNDDYEKARGKYIVNESNLSLIRRDARVLHPLPHVEEIALPIQVENSDPRIAYFRQVQNGLYARMALLYKMLA